MYEEFDVLLYRQGSEQGPIYSQTARDILGWQTEAEAGELFETEYLFTDYNGDKIRCLHNTENRPFYKALAEGWASDILHRKWRLNGETIILDWYDQLQQGQHRLIGLNLAEQVRNKDREKWSRYWGVDEELYIESLVVVGVDASDDTINTIDCGKSRTDSDVIFRSQLFRDLATKDKKRVARVCSLAQRILWLRTGQNHHQIGKSRSHTYMMKFLNDHPRLLDCVKFVVEENGEGRISTLISQGYAAALMYLMGCCKTEEGVYEGTLDESSLNWDCWDQAQEFWTLFANAHSTLAPLREYLKNIESAGTVARDEQCGAVVNAWNLFIDGDTITDESVHVALSTDDHDQVVVTDHPLLGGIDLGIQDDKFRAKLYDAEDFATTEASE